MNILHTVFSFNSGGIENLLVDIVNNWDTGEDNISLCIINEDYNSELINKIKPNIDVILLNRRKGTGKITFIFKYMKLLYRKKINVIHCHLLPAVKVSMISKIIMPRIKIFYTVHDKRIYSNFKKMDILIQNIFVDRIFAISNSVKEDIITINKKNYVDVIPNAIDLNKFNNIKKDHSNNNIIIGCVARIIPEKKGQDILLKAVKIVKEKYPNIQCWLAGEPPKGKENNLLELKELVRELNIEENVVFKGNIVDISTFLAQIDIFVLPSRYEGFGIAIIEAMASRVPVIASNLEGPKEIIKENNFGDLFNVEDYNELSNLIIKLIESNPNMKIEESYKYVEKNFNINVINQRLKTIYSEEKIYEY